ncbi:MAG: hypothetical protein ACRD25_03485 [Terracidiphilus sp.]
MYTTFSFSAELTAPAELRGRTPRRVLLTGSGIQMAIAAAILLTLAAAGAVWAGSAAVRERQHNSALHNHGRETEGAITRLEVSNSLESRVSYTFSAGGATYSGEARVPENLIRPLAKSKSLPILYFPANPAINHPVAWEPSPDSQLVLLVAPAIAAVLGLALFIPLGIEHRMAAEGKPALAVVRKCTRGKSGYLVKYEFRLGDETPIEGQGWCKNQQELGNGIWVLYLRGRPRRNLPYPLTYYRAIE